MWLNEQIQFQFAVNPTYTFMVPSEPFHIMQIQRAQPATPVLTRLGQSNQPILNLFILISQQRHISLTTLADRECTACQRNANTTRSDCFLGHLASERRPHYFCKRVLHQFILHHNIHFRRAFSAFNCFISEMSDASMLPYFERHW